MFFGKSSIIDKKRQFRLDFYKLSSHQWILDDEKIKRSFDLLFDRFNVEVLDFFSKKKKLIFAPAQGKWACAVPSTKSHHLILIFPSLLKNLRSPDFSLGQSILAHEIGHIFLGHSERKLETLDAQFEADYFSYLLGLGEELVIFLNNFSHIEESRKRIEKIKSLTREEELP